MAEGLARHAAPPGVSVYSAGSEPGTLNPYAVRALAELGIDIKDHTSKGFADVPMDRANTVITLCAEEDCPIIPSNAKRLSWAMPDPAAQGNDDESKLEAFRVARERITEHLRAFWQKLEQKTNSG